MTWATGKALAGAAACLTLAGCATQPTGARARLIDIPLASIHADIRFTINGGYKQEPGCTGVATCVTPESPGDTVRFSQQVKRVAAALQDGAKELYPDLAQRVPGLVQNRFDVYVVAGDEPGSASSANGRIALNSGLGNLAPYDEWLAFVIAREMGHVIARHHEENSAASITTSVLLNILIPGSSLLKSAISAGGAGIAASSKRDVQAPEADTIALNLLTASGFRLEDVALALRVATAPGGDASWANSFRSSSHTLRAEAVRVAAADEAQAILRRNLILAQGN